MLLILMVTAGSWAWAYDHEKTGAEYCIESFSGIQNEKGSRKNTLSYFCHSGSKQLSTFRYGRVGEYFMYKVSYTLGTWIVSTAPLEYRIISEWQ